MRILALDMAGITGWAVSRHENHLSGTWRISPVRGESPGMRYIKLRACLNEVYKAFPDIRLVVYEQAHHRGGAATEYAAGCVAHVQAWCSELKIEHASYHSASIKSHVCSGKKPSKQDVINAIRNLGYDPADDNEADAIALLLLAHSHLNVELKE